MSSLKISVGDTIPKGTFATIPFTEELADHVSYIALNHSIVVTNMPGYPQSVCGIRACCFLPVPVVE
jgi:hypothetical protein